MEIGGETESPPRLSSSRPRRISTTTPITPEAQAPGHLEIGRSAGGYKRKGGRGSGWQTPQSASASATASTRAKRPRVLISSSSGRKPSAAAGAPPPDVVNLEEEYQVQKILDKKIGQGGQLLYYIKWIGWPESANTWEPLENLDGCEEVVKEFEVHWLQQQKEKNDGAGPSGVSMSKVNGEPKLTQEKSSASAASSSSATASGVRARTTVPVPTPTVTPTPTSQLTHKVNDESEEFMEYDILSKCPADKSPKELIGVVEIGGLLTYLIEWEHLKENQSTVVGVGVEGGATEEEPDRRLIKALPFKLMYPAMVIKYYEGHINFTNGTPVPGQLGLQT